MRWVRVVLAAVLGFVLSQGLNGFFVYFWYFGNRSVGLPLLVVLTVTFFAVAGCFAGYATGRIAGGGAKLAGIIAAGLIVAVTIGNIVLDVAAEPLGHKLVVIFLMAPVVAVMAAREGPGTSIEPQSPD